MSEVALVRRLRERVEELEETVRQLTSKEEERATSLPEDVPALRPTEARLLGALLRKGHLSKHGAYFAIYGDREDRQMKTVDVWVCFLRKKLAGTRYRITTRWGAGYLLETQAITSDSPTINSIPTSH